MPMGCPVCREEMLDSIFGDKFGDAVDVEYSLFKDEKAAEASK